MNNIVKLAEIFDKFIEVGDSFVIAEDIRAVKKKEVGDLTIDNDVPENGPQTIPGYKGIEVITPYGTYVDTAETFESFKKRMNDLCQMRKSQLLEKVTIPIKSSVKAPIAQPQRKVISIEDKEDTPNSPRRINRVSIPISGAAGGARGQLPEVDKEPDSPKLVDRDDMVIRNSGGVEIGHGHADGGGTIVGPHVSGFINTSGEYRLVFKDYSESEAFISYSIGEGK